MREEIRVRFGRDDKGKIGARVRDDVGVLHPLGLAVRPMNAAVLMNKGSLQQTADPSAPVGMTRGEEWLKEQWLWTCSFVA